MIQSRMQQQAKWTVSDRRDSSWSIFICMFSNLYLITLELHCGCVFPKSEDDELATGPVWLFSLSMPCIIWCSVMPPFFYFTETKWRMIRSYRHSRRTLPRFMFLGGTWAQYAGVCFLLTLACIAWVKYVWSLWMWKSKISLMLSVGRKVKSINNH